MVLMNKSLLIVLSCVVVIFSGYAMAAYVFTPEDQKKPAEDNTPIITISGGCLDCIEEKLQNAHGLHHLVIGYTGGELALPTREDFKKGRPGHNVSLQIYFEPRSKSTEELIRIFIEGIHSQDPAQRKAWLKENGHDLIFYTENKEQNRVIKRIMTKANEVFFPKEKISYKLRVANTFWVAAPEDQRFFNTFDDVVRIEQARRDAGQTSQKKRLSKLERLRNKNSIFNLNSSK